MSAFTDDDVQRGADAYARGLSDGSFAAALGPIPDRVSDWDRIVARAVLAAVAPAIAARALREAADEMNDWTIEPMSGITAHVDDLLAILRLHTEDVITTGGEYYASQCDHCGSASDWPCETVRIVADRLTGWGVL